MIGKAVGWFFITSRTAVAKLLIKAGVSPNALTVLGALITIGAGMCFAAGGGDGFTLSLRTGTGLSACRHCGRDPIR